jgi:carbon storage regulator
LILSRRVGEKLIIDLGDRIIEIVTLGINGNQVKIGIQAPDDIPVHRLEIWEKIQKEKG